MHASAEGDSCLGKFCCPGGPDCLALENMYRQVFACALHTSTHTTAENGRCVGTGCEALDQHIINQAYLQSKSKLGRLVLALHQVIHCSRPLAVSSSYLTAV